MATTASEDFTRAGVLLFQVIFSLMFPFLILLTCLASYILTYWCHLPQFAFWALLFGMAFEYAQGHLWAMLALVVVAIVALPLAWVAMREWPVTLSKLIGGWVVVAGLVAAVVWLDTVWPLNWSVWQAVTYGIALLLTCAGLCDALLSTFKMLSLRQPRRGREVVEAQKAHGDARVASEAEAVALLTSNK